MKKKVICFFSLILYLLVACSFLSEKIDAEMVTQVSGTHVKGTSGNVNPRYYSPSILFSSGGGMVLFEAYQGKGWEAGMRAGIVDQESWKMTLEADGEKVEYIPSHDSLIVMSASRTPVEGELVEGIGKLEIGPDTYLVCPSGEVYFEALPEGVTLLAQSDTALVLSAEESSFPFFEHRAAAQLRYLSPEPMRVYSLTDIEQFIGNVPAVVLTLVLLCVPLVLWGYSFWLVCCDRENKVLLWVNAITTVAVTGIAYRLLQTIDFPASLMPESVVFDWRHYKTEFDIIFGALETLGETVHNTLLAADTVWSACRNILLGSSVLAVALVLAEHISARWWNKRRQ